MWLVLIAACAAAPASPPPPDIDGAAAWSFLSQQLPGSWRLVRAAAPELDVTYTLISNASALVEDWGVGSSHETETVFYPDHARVLLTHFCAQGNQPRLQAVERTADSVRFRYLDVTNRAADQDMLVDLTVRIVPGALEITEIYRSAKGSDEVTTYKFVRR